MRIRPAAIVLGGSWCFRNKCGMAGGGGGPLSIGPVQCELVGLLSRGS